MSVDDYLDNLERIDNFGVWSVPIRELAKLVAIEMFYGAQISIKGFDPEIEYDLNGETFLSALSPHVIRVENSMIACIERREIKTTWLKRLLDTGKIDTANTLISSEEFFKFLELFGLDGEIACEEGWPIRDRLEVEGGLSYDVSEYIRRVRSFGGKADKAFIASEKNKYAENPELLEMLIMENFALKFNAKPQAGKDDQVDKPITTRERNTLLTIIAALAKEAKIDLSKPAKAGEAIAHLTELIGAPVDHSTIEGKIKQISEAVKARQK